MNKDYGFKYFHEIDDAALRVWNRCAVMLNISEAHGEEKAEQYAKGLTADEQVQMYAMYKYIQVKGYEAVKAEVNKGVVEGGSNVKH